VSRSAGKCLAGGDGPAAGRAIATHEGNLVVFVGAAGACFLIMRFRWSTVASDSENQ